MGLSIVLILCSAFPSRSKYSMLYEPGRLRYDISLAVRWIMINNGILCISIR